MDFTQECTSGRMAGAVLRPLGHINQDQTNSAIEVVLKYTLHGSVPGLHPSQGHSKRQDGWCLG